MKRDTLNTILLVVISVLAGLGVLFYHHIKDQRLLGVKIVTEDRIAEIISGKDEISADTSILAINGNPVPYDVTDNRIFISQDMEKEKWTGVLSANNGKIYFVQNEFADNKKENIKTGQKNVLYWVGPNNYFVTNVIATGMPVMTLDTWCDVSEGVWGGAMQLYDPTEYENDYQSGVCNFAIRGNIARLYDKKSYKLTLSDEKMSLCGLRTDDDWILNALYDDIGLVRNKLSYQLWNELAATNDVPNDSTVETEYLELIVNGEYCGVYLLSDRIDAKKLNLSKEDYLYKQRSWSGKRTSLENAFIVSYPNEYDEDDIKPMLHFMEEVYYPKEYGTSLETLKDKVYLENVVDYYLYCMMIAAGDNLFDNSYFVAEPLESGEYRFKEIPWDMNATFGNIRVNYFEERETEIDNLTSKIAKALLESDDETFLKMASSRWNEVNSTVFSEENITELATEYIEYTENSGAYARNLERWPEYKVNNGNNESKRMKELWNKQQFYDFIKIRREFLNSYYSK